MAVPFDILPGCFVEASKYCGRLVTLGVRRAADVGIAIHILPLVNNSERRSLAEQLTYAGRDTRPAAQDGGTDRALDVCALCGDPHDLTNREQRVALRGATEGDLLADKERRTVAVYWGVQGITSCVLGL